MKFTSAMLDTTSMWAESLSKTMIKSDRAAPIAVWGTAGMVGVVTTIQLCTDWDPVGRCLVFWKQLRDHVSL